MKRRTVLRAAAALAAPSLVRARAQTRVRRIGVLSSANPEVAAFYRTALENRLRELGWQPGIDTVFERRYAYGDPSRLDALAAELVDAKVDVIIASYDSGAWRRAGPRRRSRSWRPT